MGFFVCYNSLIIDTIANFSKKTTIKGMKRAIIVVIDSMGIGAMPDAPEYGDIMECNTLKNVANYNNGLNIPNLHKLGLCNLCEVKNRKPVDDFSAQIAVMKETSKGKCTTTGQIFNSIDEAKRYFNIKAFHISSVF